MEKQQNRAPAVILMGLRSYIFKTCMFSNLYRIPKSRETLTGKKKHKSGLMLAK